MRDIRIFLDDPELGPGPATLVDQAAKHVARVLRMKSGQSLTIFDGIGHEYLATIERCTGSRVDLNVGERVSVDRESPLRLTLAVAMARGERMDLVIQKATELGATEIVPLQSARTVVQLAPDRAAKRQKHWRHVAISACEQCGRNRLPTIHPVCSLSEWLQSMPGAGDGELRLIADPHGGHALELNGIQARQLRLLTGPEGGFTEAELAIAAGSGFQSVLLGPRILRAETAAIALLAVIQWQLGDLRCD